MNAKEIKQVRGQIRQIVNEILPELLTAELKSKLFGKLSDMVAKRMDLIEERTKDIQSYMVRQSALSMPAPNLDASAPTTDSQKS